MKIEVRTIEEAYLEKGRGPDKGSKKLEEKRTIDEFEKGRGPDKGPRKKHVGTIAGYLEENPADRRKRDADRRKNLEDLGEKRMEAEIASKNKSIEDADLEKGRGPDKTPRKRKGFHVNPGDTVQFKTQVGFMKFATKSGKVVKVVGDEDTGKIYKIHIESGGKTYIKPWN